MSITNKLAFYFLTLGLLIVTIALSFSFYNRKEAIFNRTVDQLISVREVKKNHLEAFFADRIRDISLIAQSNDAKQIVESISPNHTHISIDNNAYLLNYLNACSYYKYLIISNTQYNIVVINPMVKQENNISIHPSDSFGITAIIKKAIAEDRVIIQDFNWDRTSKEPVLYVAVPIKKSNHTIGVALLGITVAAVNSIMLEENDNAGLGKTGESYLVGEDKLMRSDSRFRKQSVLTQKVESEAVNFAFADSSATNKISDYRGVTVISSYGKVNILDVNWIILAEIDYAEAMKSVYNIRTEIVILSMLIFFIVFMFAETIRRQITQPIIHLKNAAEHIKQGFFTKHIHLKKGASDEIGELIDSFNDMANQLIIQTQEVKERGDRLNHFYDATIDGIILFDEKSTLLVNQALSNLTGYSINELMAMPLDKIMDRQSHQNNGLHSENIHTYETIGYRKDKTVFPIEIQERFINFDQKTIKACVIRDISERKKMEMLISSEKQRRISSMLDGQEMERKRLSRELHDGLGQSLIALKLKLENTIDLDMENTRKTVDEVKQLFSGIIDEVRQMSYDLMPSVLYELGLITAIKNLCREIERQTKTNIVFFENDMPEIMPEKSATYIYRLIQESLNNMVKHARANNVTINLFSEKEQLVLSIEDDGVGFDEKTIKPGNGLFNMRERVQILKGTITFDSRINKGTIITITIPLTEINT